MLLLGDRMWLGGGDPQGLLVHHPQPISLNAGFREKLEVGAIYNVLLFLAGHFSAHAMLASVAEYASRATGVGYLDEGLDLSVHSARTQEEQRRRSAPMAGDDPGKRSPGGPSQGGLPPPRDRLRCGRPRRLPPSRP